MSATGAGDVGLNVGVAGIAALCSIGGGFLASRLRPTTPLLSVVIAWTSVQSVPDTLLGFLIAVGAGAAQIRRFRRRHPEHPMPAPAENTAIGNHAGPVGSMITSNTVPAGAPPSAVCSTAVKFSTVGHAFRFAIVTPDSSSTRTVCALAIPRSIPTSLLQPITTLPRLVSLLTPAASSDDDHDGHGPKEDTLNRDSHSCAATGSDLEGPSHFPHPGHPWPSRTWQSVGRGRTRSSPQTRLSTPPPETTDRRDQAPMSLT